MHRWILRPAIGARVCQVTTQARCTLIRQASLNSAIGRGIRRSEYRPRDSESTDDRQRSRRDETRTPSRRFSERQDSREQRPFRERRFSDNRGSNEDRPQRERRFSDNRGFNEDRPQRERRFSENRDSREQRPYRERAFPEDRDSKDQRPHRDRKSFDEGEFIRSGNFRGLPLEHQARGQSRWKQENSFPDSMPPRPRSPTTKSRAHRITETMPERVKDNVKVPDSIPYTTPASEFIYGTSAVEAALRCSRRQLYKLYVYQAAGEDLSPAKMALRKLALSKNIAIKMAFAGWDRLLDKMSAGRPHNGCILEASPLPKLPVRALAAIPSATESHFQVELAPQTREEALVNGTDDRIPIIQPESSTREDKTPRFPVALLLDGVVDPGNMGAIIRSAYYLGVDAIIFAGRNSAPLSPVTLKASAGAAENMTLLHVKNEVDFIQRSQANGWRFYAADAPGPDATHISRVEPDGARNSGGLLATQSPSVLMMGSEGSGLSTHIKSHADAIVSIPGARHSADLGVRSDPARIDSLNVSVAAALLMEMFLRTPLVLSEPLKKVKEKMW
ncbi:tRNA/rRNA methyltransferase SpoU [Penicillium malachiteum]|uniref:tRNA/rRNA methyltransferase SpoU n=1 Tax=Penicillium malachiteum TaxID=1324776 RepID=UPI0025481CAF|nr:tRNA/rRNA methyltransferase SpoU [Penicillium malachiteum]KAJ5731760.1 tRNA/rRNA methyltransferase SpoU [Penicillium malachiteum]